MGLMTTRMLALVLLLCGNGIECLDTDPLGAEVCPISAVDIQRKLSRASEYEGLFMNFGAPAQCNGTVKSWHYCYYDSCEGTGMYTSTFMIFRQSRSSVYELVTKSKKRVDITRPNCPRPGRERFKCREVVLSPTEQFIIQQNDIVAACLMDTPPIAPIRILGIDDQGPMRASSNNMVYEYGDYSFQECTMTHLDVIDINRSNFILQQNGILHLQPEISGLLARQCSGGSNPPPFSPSVVSGTYLNTASPISCSDTITSWHYCYYPSAAADSQLTYTATVGVWRLNTDLNQYELLPESDHTLQLAQPQRNTAKILCKTEVLQTLEYVSTLTGDVIGATLPTENPLPLVATDAVGYSLMRLAGVEAETSIRITVSTREPNKALHLLPSFDTDKQSVMPNHSTSTRMPKHKMPLQSVDNHTTSSRGPLGNGRDQGHDHKIDGYISIGVGLLNVTIIVLTVIACVVFRIHKATRQGARQSNTESLTISRGRTQAVNTQIFSSFAGNRNDSFNVRNVDAQRKSAVVQHITEEQPQSIQEYSIKNVAIKPNVAYNAIDIKSDMDSTQINIAYQKNYILI